MEFVLNIIDWQARAPGLSESSQWQQWSQQSDYIDPMAPQAKTTALPMMIARRLGSGSRLAVECGLIMLQRHNIDAVLYTSRHGELERNYRILQMLAQNQAVSPTDFALSVHNSAVGSLTIAAQQPIVSSSVSAGMDSFQQGLYEVICLLQAGYRRVLMVDFDGYLPAFYQQSLPANLPGWAYAVALVIEAGQTLRCVSRSHSSAIQPEMVQSLQFLRWYLSDKPGQVIAGDRLQWCWSRT